MEKRYDKKGKARPCFLERSDLADLARLIQETFTKPEIERYFRVSTTINGHRVFCNSMGDFGVQNDLPDRTHDLSFWIEGWGQKSRFDKTVLLDFSRHSVQLEVEGTDPVWVFDKYNRLMKFLQSKSPWYWPVIVFEKGIIFSLTVLLILSMILSFKLHNPVADPGKIAMVVVLGVLFLYDTRKIWPYAVIRLQGAEPLFSKENLLFAALLLTVLLILLQGFVMPFLR